MRRHLGLCLVALAFAGGTCWAADKIDNPLYKHWSKFKPGTTVTVKTESEMAGNKSEMETTTTLLSVDADKATIESKMSMNAGGQKMDMPATKTEVAAKIDPPPAAPATATPKADVKESSEAIDVAGTKVTCKVTETASDQGGMKTMSKSWTSDDVPGMMAKMESTMDGTMKGTTKMMVTAMTVK